METDLTSILIGLASLATFFIPIGLYQFLQKRKAKLTEKAFFSAAAKFRLSINRHDILRNGIAIGIDDSKQTILHVIGEDSRIIHLSTIAGIKSYKSLKKEDLEDGSHINIQETGIHIHLQNRGAVKIPVFRGKEGSTLGDETRIAERWIRTIQEARND